jgi:glycosyltransferase involved in cell wall biosynthesis
MLKWNIAARFFESDKAVWLDDFIHDPDLGFRKIPAGKEESWHVSRKAQTSIRKWLNLAGQGWSSFHGNPHGIITCFPPLAMIAAIRKRLSGRKTRIVAYNFNLGGLPAGVKQTLARFAAKGVDVFVVHSPSEVTSYADYLGVAPQRVKFIPLQRGRIDIPRVENTDAPFVLAMGSAGRDYKTLIAAVDTLGVRTIIVTRKDIIESLPLSKHVTFRHGLSEVECLELLATARLSVVPLGNLATASGQVTFINSMMLGIPLIATRCPGTEGYVEDGLTGLLVDPFDGAGLEQAIASLWNDPVRRAELARRAMAFAHEHLSDEAAAETLRRLLRSLDPS